MKKKSKKKNKRSAAEVAFNKRGFTIIAEPVNGNDLAARLLAFFATEKKLLDRIQKSLKQTRKDGENAPDFLKEAKKKTKRGKK
jgi:hypothetical protein